MWGGRGGGGGGAYVSSSLLNVVTHFRHGKCDLLSEIPALFFKTWDKTANTH